MQDKCSLETMLEDFFNEQGIEYTRPESNPQWTRPTGKTMDFYIYSLDLFIEVKAHGTPRMDEQLVRNNLTSGPVLVIVGLEAVKAFIIMCKLSY